MSMMYRIFYGILGAGMISGVLFAFWAKMWENSHASFMLFLGLSAAVGLLLGFANYVFVKWVLRIFVKKFFVLERVLVGTEPQELGNVFVSNEIDEMEASMVRISEEFNKLRTNVRATQMPTSKSTNGRTS